MGYCTITNKEELASFLADMMLKEADGAFGMTLTGYPQREGHHATEDSYNEARKEDAAICDDIGNKAMPNLLPIISRLTGACYCSAVKPSRCDFCSGLRAIELDEHIKNRLNTLQISYDDWHCPKSH